MMRKIGAVFMLAASLVLVWFVFFSPDTQTLPPVTHQGIALYEPRNWKQINQSPMNLSLFTFRDRNRNGVYDTADLPMAAVVVKLIPQTDDAKVHFAHSNINGYANFEMHADHPEQPIAEANIDYNFLVLPPPGWLVTTKNTEQRVHIINLAGSVSGLVAENPPNWVGLAPELSISLKVTIKDGPAKPEEFSLQIATPTGESLSFTINPDGNISIPAYPGSWQITVRQTGTTWQHKQTIAVRNAPVILAPIKLGSNQQPPLSTQIVENFDWLNRSVIDKIPNGYLGLNWSYLLAVDNQYYRGPGYVNGLESGSAVAYNSSGHPVTISARINEKFDFVGGYFSSAWPLAEGEVLDITAWRDGKIVSKTALVLSYLGPVWLQADLHQLDKLTLSTRHYWQFVSDDLTFRVQNPPTD